VQGGIYILGWETTWQQRFQKTSEMCMYWQTCMDHQQKTTFAALPFGNVEKYHCYRLQSAHGLCQKKRDNG